MGDLVRIAALADLHCAKTSQGAFQPLFGRIAESAELLLIAGDLTDYGLPEEARVLARELSGLRVPIVAVLGNHDVESEKEDEVRQILRDTGMTILDGDACELLGIGIAGVKGFGGGFGQRALGPWGEATIKQFVREAVNEALKLEAALARLRTAQMIALFGGAFAFSHYSHVPRETKDIDVFVKPDDCLRALEAFERCGCSTELTFPDWLGKIRSDDHLIDVIFSSGNALARVDDLWFEHAPKTKVLGLIVRLCPAEEMIWSKAFIQERERFDGADVLHLLRETGPSLDWPRLLMRFGDHWRVLLSHLVLFGYVYPDKRQNIPAWVMDELVRRLSVSRPNLQNDVCYGTLLSREQYVHDITTLKYRDGRREPDGPMTREQIEIWTAAIGKE